MIHDNWWKLIESIWQQYPSLNRTRKRAVELTDQAALEQINWLLDQFIARELHKKFNSLDMTQRNQIIQAKNQLLKQLSRIPTPGGFSGSFRKASEGFVMGMGQVYFQKVTNGQAELKPELSSEQMGEWVAKDTAPGS